jgi:protein transport protein SEC20
MSLDQLHQAALAKVQAIVNASGSPGGPADEILCELQRRTLAHEAYEAIAQYRNALRMAQALTPNFASELYSDRLTDLKLRLRRAQVLSAEAENAAVQRQRLRHHVERDDGDGRQALFGDRTTKPAAAAAANPLLDKNKAITASLQQTRQMMAASVMHTELNIDSVTQQTKDLTQLNDQFTAFGDLLVRLRTIVKFIQKQDRSDKNRIYGSLIFLACACAWVVWRRLLKMPVYVLLWSLMKVFRVFTWALGGLAGTAVTSVAVSVATAASTASLTASMVSLAATASLAASMVSLAATASAAATASPVTAALSETSLSPSLDTYTMDLGEAVYRTWEELAHDEL